MWRFLQLRGYVDDKHNLTAWGKCLEQALSAVDPTDNLEDAIFIAIEMLRLNLLNTKHWFSHVSGGPMRGSGKSHSHSHSHSFWVMSPDWADLAVQRRTRRSTCWYPVWPALRSCSTSLSDTLALLAGNSFATAL